MTTSYAENASARPPRRSPLRWLLPLLLALTGLGLLAYGIPALNGTWTSSPVAVKSGDSVSSERGFSVYAKADFARNQTVCTAKGTGGTVTLSRPVAESIHRMKGERFYEVARTPTDLADGAYTLTCTGTTERLAVGSRGDVVVGGLRRAELLTPLGAACLLAAGLTALLLLLAGRHQQRLLTPNPLPGPLPPGPFRSPVPLVAPYPSAAQGYPPPAGQPYLSPVLAPDPLLDEEQASSAHGRPRVVAPGPLPAPTRDAYWPYAEEGRETFAAGVASGDPTDATVITAEPPTIVAPGPLPAPPQPRG